MSISDAQALTKELERQKKAPPARTVQDLIESMRPELERSLQSDRAADILTRHYFTALRYSPLLLTCTAESQIAALLLTAQVRLEPGPLGHVYLVPYRNAKKGVHEVLWLLGYTGIVELARRGGATGLRSTVVWSGDDWTGIRNVNGTLRYTHAPAQERTEDAERVGVLVEWKDGTHNAVWCPPSRIKRAQDASAAFKTGAGPWFTDTEAMWRKTGVRFARPFLPLSVEMATAGAMDDRVTVLEHGEAGELVVEARGDARVLTEPVESADA